MASISKYPARDCWRVQYFIYLKGKKIRKSRYPKTQGEARLLAIQLGHLEQASRQQYATRQEVEAWVERGWIPEEQASLIFPGYEEVIEHNRRISSGSQQTYYQAVLVAYEEYSLNSGKGGEDRANLKTHRNNMSMARQVVSWLEAEVPNLPDLTAARVRKHLEILRKSGYTEWTVSNYLMKMRLLLDQAVILDMIRNNPARNVTIKQPKTATERRILSGEEASHLLEVSLNYRKYMSGSLPTVVRLGLYAGLRNQEMCWLKWDSIDWANRIISIKETTCEETGRTWVPKDYEMRRLDIKEACIDYLAEERQRQAQEEILGPFVMPGGDQRRSHYRHRPLSENVPQRTFSKMIQAEELDSAITVYSLRHTYATMGLRSGVDLRTLQRRMGHSDIKTTMEYLHFIEPEEHPMDKLPY